MRRNLPTLQQLLPRRLARERPLAEADPHRAQHRSRPKHQIRPLPDQTPAQPNLIPKHPRLSRRSPQCPWQRSRPKQISQDPGVHPVRLVLRLGDHPNLSRIHDDHLSPQTFQDLGRPPAASRSLENHSDPLPITMLNHLCKPRPTARYLPLRDSTTPRRHEAERARLRVQIQPTIDHGHPPLGLVADRKLALPAGGWPLSSRISQGLSPRSPGGQLCSERPVCETPGKMG
jgi:hypothetical protein